MQATTQQKAEYVSRHLRVTHPRGTFDKAARWYPDETERAACCAQVRQPSRAYPWSILAHYRTLKHIVTRDEERTLLGTM